MKCSWVFCEGGRLFCERWVCFVREVGCFVREMWHFLREFKCFVREVGLKCSRISLFRLVSLFIIHGSESIVHRLQRVDFLRSNVG